MRKNNLIIALGWLICFLGAFFYCYEYLLRIEPSVMIPELMHQFKVGATGFGVLIALYYYMYAPMQLVVGVVIDSKGVRSVLSIAVLFCAFGSLIFGTTSSIYIAGIGRLMIGFGSAFAFVAVMKLAAIWLPKQNFAMFTGFATALGMLGAMFGDIELGCLVNTIGWKSVIHLGTIIGFVLVPFIWLIIKDTRKVKPFFYHERHDMDESLGWKQSFIGFMGIFKNPQMWLIGIIGCFLYLSLSVFGELWGIPFLQSVYHLSSTKAGLLCSSVFLGWLVGAPINGLLSDKLKMRKQLIAVGAFLATILISIVIYKPTIISTKSLAIILFLFGFFSSVEIICFAISKEDNPTYLAATSIAFANFLIMLGGLVFQPLIGHLLDLGWDGQVANKLHIYSASDYTHVFLLIPVAMLLAGLLTFFIKPVVKHNSLLGSVISGNKR